MTRPGSPRRCKTGRRSGRHSDRWHSCPHFGRTVTITRSCAGTMSSRSVRSSPILCSRHCRTIGPGGNGDAAAAGTDRAVRFDDDHYCLLLGAFRNQAHNDPGEDPTAAPALPTVIEDLARALLLRNIVPSQPIVIDENHAAQDMSNNDAQMFMTLEEEGGEGASSTPRSARTGCSSLRSLCKG